MTGLRLMLSNTIATPLITGGLGLLGTLATAAITWAKDHKASARRHQLLEEEIKRLTFWEAWLKIQSSAATSESELAELQRRILDEASAASANVKEAFQRPTGKSPLTGKQVVAVLLSSFIPGFGQFYNSDTKKGVVMLAAYALCVGLSATRIGLLAILPIVIWSTIDAYRVSSGKSQRW
jgi:TM2 domain-containing membrane protein YozV